MILSCVFDSVDIYLMVVLAHLESCSNPEIKPQDISVFINVTMADPIKLMRGSRMRR
jgi:hypothetical protein